MKFFAVAPASIGVRTAKFREYKNYAVRS